MINGSHILITLLGSAAFLLLVAAYGDILKRRISNRLTLGLACVGGLYGLSSWFAGTSFYVAAVYPLLTASALFLLGLVLFQYRVMGGGDVKLMAAFGLIAGPDYILSFLLITALLGGALALGMLLALKLFPTNKLAPPVVGDITAAHTVTIPYGVAIAGAGLWVCQALLRILIA